MGTRPHSREGVDDRVILVPITIDEARALTYDFTQGYSTRWAKTREALKSAKQKIDSVRKGATMPFKDGIWTPPVEGEQREFTNKINTKVVKEIVPTTELVDAITQQMAPPAQPRKDLTRAVEQLQGPCDIVIPIYGSLHVVKPCIESVLKRTSYPFNLILVDDASPDEAVREYLAELGGSSPSSLASRPLKASIKILFNETNRGFPATVNRGVAAGSSPYICILNSDTLVTEGWLTSQLIALEDDPRNVITNPVTNNTALINVPMYNGTSYLDMAHAVAVAPNTPTFNEIMPTGFCFTMRRKLWEEIGPFDEAFGAGYGEETSFWMYALKQTDEKGVVLDNQAVIADNAYIFHERGTSFSQLGEDKHMGSRRSGNERFHKLHPDFGKWREGYDENEAINHLKHQLPREVFKRDFRGNVAWVVKSAAACGGMNFIADIVNELIEQGYNAKVCVVPDNYDPQMDKQLAVTNHLRCSPILFKTQEEFTEQFTSRVFTQGVIFSAVTERTACVAEVCFKNPALKGYNHVQSYDPVLAKLAGLDHLVEPILAAYKTLPNIVSSQWIAEELKKQGATVRAVVLPGVNPDLFHPRNQKKNDRPTIAVLLSGSDENSMGIVKGHEWAKEYLNKLNIPRNPDFKVIAIGPTTLPIRGVTCIGQVSQAKMADLLGGQVDILVDPSAVHSYGLPALEALYSGCEVISRGNRGIREYSHLWSDHVRVVEHPSEAVDATIRLLSERSKRKGREKVVDSATNRFNCVNTFISTIFPDIEDKGLTVEMVTPHMRKHGGPTTLISAAKQLKLAGHDTNLTMIYTDWNPEVLRSAKPVPVRTNWQTVRDDAQVVIINSDNPYAPQLMAARPGAKFIMYKLSHNPRFQQTENDNLNLPWDHIMTSTSWLRNACITPMEGWTHKAWPEDKVSVVGWYHYGHDAFNLDPTQRTYGTSMSGFRVGTLIHEHPLKGSKTAISAMQGLKNKYNNFIHLAGFGEVKAQVPEWLQYFKGAGRKDMAHAFKQLDIWLGASASEGLGRMSLEAMSAGVAVVTTNTGAEFLVDGENCLLYEPGDAQKAAELVDRLATDQHLFTKIAVNGYRTAVAASNPDNFRYNLNVIVRRVA